MDSTSVGVADILKSVDLTTLAIITGAIGLFHPWITDLASGLWFDKIQSDKVRKAAIFLFGAVIGFVLAILVNLIGEFKLPLFVCFLVGSGLYTTIGEGVYQARKHIAKDGTNGESQ